MIGERPRRASAAQPRGRRWITDSRLVTNWKDDEVRETEVEAAFVRYLLDRGWDVDTDKIDHADVVARRGAEHIVAEVKGTTTSPGLDVDTAYGQLLRRMGDRPEGTRFAIVVPESARKAAVRVPAEIRWKFGIDVWVVTELGSVELAED